MAFSNSEEKLNKWHQEMLDLGEKRQHKLIEGKLSKTKNDQCYVIYCEKHDLTYTTSFKNYQRSVIGCLLCGRESVSKKLAGREFSPETLEKMTISAQSRPYRGGKPRRWRETNSYRAWNAAVREEFDNQCAITGVKNLEKGDGLLVVHHLIGANLNDSLALTVENGIVLHKDLHKKFHSLYGYHKNTVEQFLDFLQKIQNNEIIVPISSQTESEGSGGSETRVYD